MIGERDEGRSGWGGEGGVGVDGQFAVFGNVVTMGTRLVVGGDLCGRSTFRADVEEVALGRFVRGGDVVDVASLGVEVSQVDDVKVAFGDRRHLSFGRDPAELKPACRIAEPEEVVIDEADGVDVFNPGGIGFGVEGFRFAGGWVGAEEFEFVLESVELEGDDRGAIGVPVGFGEVVVSRIPWNFEPGGFAPLDRDDAESDRGVGLACFRIGEGGEDGVFTLSLVEEPELFDVGSVELPEEEARAIGMPAEGIALAELFFVDPVGDAVDEGIGAIGGELGDFEVGEVLDEEVVLTDVRDVRAVFGELGEHHGRSWCIAAELSECVVLEIEEPVVASGIVSPDFLRVGEEEDLGFVVGESEAGDAEWAIGFFRGELFGGGEDGFLVGFGIDFDEGLLWLFLFVFFVSLLLVARFFFRFVFFFLCFWFFSFFFCGSFEGEVVAAVFAPGDGAGGFGFEFLVFEETIDSEKRGVCLFIVLLFFVLGESEGREGDEEKDDQEWRVFHGVRNNTWIEFKWQRYEESSEEGS